jgi:hypothetical protein
MIIPTRQARRVQNLNYRTIRPRGLGDATDCTPSSCAGPYSNPIYNYAYQQQVATTAGYQPPQGSDTAPIPKQYQPYIAQQMNAAAPTWDYNAAHAAVPYQNPGIPPDPGIVMGNQQAENAFNSWWTTNNGVHPLTDKFVWAGPDVSQLPGFLNNQNPGTGKGFSVTSSAAGFSPGPAVDYSAVFATLKKQSDALQLQQGILQTGGANPVLPTPISSASPANAPGGPAAPATAPTPIQSGAPIGATPLPFTLPDSISSLPTWAWIVAAAVAVFVIGGKN